MGLLDTATSVSEKSKWIKLLLYGYPGVGKTVLAAGSPTPFWLDFERSSDVLAYWPEYATIKGHKPKSMQEVYKIVQEFEKQKDYQTLVFDTVTRMQFFQIAEHMDTVQGRDKHLPLFQDFRLSTEVLDRIFTKLQDMEKNVIFVAHAKEDTNDEGRVIKIRPDLTPAVGSRLNGLLNVTAYLDFRGDKRTLLVNPTNLIWAKNRLNISMKIENPTLDKLFNRSTHD